MSSRSWYVALGWPMNSAASSLWDRMEHLRARGVTHFMAGMNLVHRSIVYRLCVDGYCRYGLASGAPEAESLPARSQGQSFQRERGCSVRQSWGWLPSGFSVLWHLLTRIGCLRRHTKAAWVLRFTILKDWQTGKLHSSFKSSVLAVVGDFLSAAKGGAPKGGAPKGWDESGFGMKAVR